MNNSLFNLSGKKALVTGGNGGIGLGMAKALAEAGADVAIWGRNAEKNREAVKTLKKFGTNVIAYEVDVSDRQAIVSAMKETVCALGGLTTVIANAGISTSVRSFIDLDDDAYDQLMAINTDGLVFTLREAARHMVAQYKANEKFKGSLVIMSSLGAIEGMAGNQHYAASKGAAISVTKACAVEFARFNIRANAVLPGFIETDMTAAYINSASMNDKVLPRVPVRRWGQSDDLSGIAVYLASDASSYQTGSSVVIDGGYSVF